MPDDATPSMPADGVVPARPGDPSPDAAPSADAAARAGEVPGRDASPPSPGASTDEAPHAVTPSTLPRDGIRRLLAEPNLRRLWTAQAWSAAGEALAQIAMPLLVYELSGSARLVGLVALALVIPRVLLAPVAGLLVDRLDRRRLMIAADLERLLLVALVPLCGEAWQVAALAVGIAVGNAVARPAELAAVPSVAGEGRLVAALSLFQVTNAIIRVVVPAAGAAVVATTGPGPAFWLQAGCFVGSLSALRRLVLPRLDRPEPVPGGGLLASATGELWAGLRAIRDVPIIRGIAASEALWQLVSGALVVTAVVYTQETLDLGDRADAAFALMTTSISAGAVVGALVASRLEARIGRARLMAVGYVGPGFMAVAALGVPLPAVYAAWFALGLADAWAVISFQAYLAEAVPEALRGRVYAAWGAIVALAGAAGYALMGVVTPWLGAERTFGAVGLIVGLGGPLLLWATGAVASIRGEGVRPAVNHS